MVPIFVPTLFHNGCCVHSNRAQLGSQRDVQLLLQSPSAPNVAVRPRPEIRRGVAWLFLREVECSGTSSTSRGNSSVDLQSRSRRRSRRTPGSSGGGNSRPASITSKWFASNVSAISTTLSTNIWWATGCGIGLRPSRSTRLATCHACLVRRRSSTSTKPRGPLSGKPPARESRAQIDQRRFRRSHSGKALQEKATESGGQEKDRQGIR
jgi:hypothetical protein